MKILVISLSPEELLLAKRFQPLGIATNPTVFRKYGKHWRDAAADALSVMDTGAFHMQAADDYDIGAAKKTILQFRDVLGSRLAVKLCITGEMLSLIPWAHSLGIPVNITCISTLAQAVLAMQAGADYISFYVGRAEKAGLDVMDSIEKSSRMIRDKGYACQIIAASIPNAEKAVEAAVAGADIAALEYPILEEMIHHDLTDKGVADFRKDFLAIS